MERRVLRLVVDNTHRRRPGAPVAAPAWVAGALARGYAVSCPACGAPLMLVASAVCCAGCQPRRAT